MIYAGDLRQNVQLQRYTVSGTGDRGQPTPKTWATYATVPAMIEELGGRKLELARQLVATATHRVTIRYHSALKVTDRVYVNGSGDVLNVGSVQNRGMFNFVLELLCTSQETGEAKTYYHVAEGGTTAAGQAG